MLFSFGLLTIVVQGFFLYTGKVGFIKKWTELFDMLIVLAGNYAGTFLTALIARAAKLPIDSADMVRAKLDNGIMSIFLLSVFCGVMMYLAIDNYNKSKNFVFVIAPVMIFILSHFEHSVANMFYFHLAASYDITTLGYIVIMAAGNGVGAKIFDVGCHFARKES